MARAGRLLTLAISVAAGACGDDAFVPDWDANPDTVALYSLERPEFELPSAYNFVTRRTVRIERAGAAAQWDLAVDTRGGVLVFLPPGAVGVISQSRLAVLPGQEFDAVEDAPADTLLYTADDPVPVQLGSVYVVRTDARPNEFGCSFFAKIEPLEVDVATGLVRFQFDGPRFCNDRRLIPPDDD